MRFRLLDAGKEIGKEKEIMKNKIMLITYADSFGKNLKELKEMVDTFFKREIGSIHILPFFPSSGDRGFAPMDYTKVEEKFLLGVYDLFTHDILIVDLIG